MKCRKKKSKTEKATKEALGKGEMPPSFKEMMDKSAKAATEAAVDKYRED